MSRLPSWRHRWTQSLERLHLQLSGAESTPQMAVLGVLTGFLASGVVLAFRLIVETAQQGFLPGGKPENFEALSPYLRLALPVVGAFIIGLIFQSIPPGDRRVGLVHVLERMVYHHGQFPLRNALAVFTGAALSLITGHSVGREGPSVHLGAACGSQLGMRLNLPHNTLRPLAGCGVAAAIGASFDTPLAGVIFAMEVVMREYTVSGFAPVILAAVSATTVTRLVYGSEPTFIVPALEAGTFSELPWMIVIGLVIGMLASVYNYLLVFFSQRLLDIPLWLRLTLGGLAVGLCALVVPEVMGIGYDTVNVALLGKLGVGVLISIAAFKLIATTACLGLGLPGGLIGPTLVIGAAAGGAMGVAAHVLMPDHSSSAAFYTVIGMGAMMGAALQAPLSALTAMLELTADPHIILPGLLTVITAGLTSSELFKTPSFIAVMVKRRGIDYRDDPISQSLRRTGVARAMERHVATLPRRVEFQHALDVLNDSPRWLIIQENQQVTAMLPGADLARYLQETSDKATIDLMEIPARRRQIAPVDLQANLQEAYDTLHKSKADALYVHWTVAPGIERIYGVLTWQDIEATYVYTPPE